MKRQQFEQYPLTQYLVVVSIALSSNFRAAIENERRPKGKRAALNSLSKQEATMHSVNSRVGGHE